jgi:uncharacterized protein YndB with AHSA1/START domain
VYDAWIDPEIRKLWWRATPEMTCEHCQIDAKVGGSYRIGMQEADGEHTACGEFIELAPPNKMVFTWSWEGMDFGKDSIVTIELFDAKFEYQPATELVLTHEKLDSAHARSEHNAGWMGCIKQLSKMYADAAVV